METSGPASLENRMATPPTLLAIDVDLHHQIASWQDVAPYAPAGLRHRLARPGGPPLARHGFKIIGPRFGEAPRPTDASGKAGEPRDRPSLGQGRVPRQARRGYRHPDRAGAEPGCPAKPRYGGRDRHGCQQLDARDLGAPIQLLQGLDPGGAPGPGPGGRGDRSPGRRAWHGPGADGQRQRDAAGPTAVPPDLRGLRPPWLCRWPCTSAARARACRRRRRRSATDDPLRVVRLAAAGLYGPLS